MPRSPRSPDQLPSINHNGTTISIIEHHGFSTPDRGPLPTPRILYGAHDKNNERHWRGSLSEMTSLIDRNFATAALASGESF